jgi:tRNA nucleotidyltransferase (CCA-adding enzyme)
MGAVTSARLSRELVPPEVFQVVERLKAAGHQAFLVGGCVRDLLRGETPKDFDVATSALPRAVKGVFRRVIDTGIEHGTVTVVEKGRHVEVTTFRAESDYVDGRRPSRVEFHEEIEADLSRRDFTINAMAWDPSDGDTVIDPFGGRADLAGRVVRCVRSAQERFSEDGLRALRAVRFATVLDFTLDPQTEAAIRPTLPVFRKVAGERIQQEFAKLLLAPSVARGLELLETTGLLASFFPEAVGGDFAAVARAPRDEAIRLALLVRAGDPVREVVLRLKFPAKVADEAAALVGCPPVPPATATDPELRRWLARVELERLSRLLAFVTARDGAAPPIQARLEALAAARPPLTTRALALDGKAIMAALAAPPGPIVGQASRYLLDLVLDDPLRNTPETLLAALKAWNDGR